MQKEAAKPTQVKSIEEAVNSPRKDQKLGNEAKAPGMINQTPAAPSIPRKDQKLGEEAKAEGMINAPNTLPEIPTGNAYIGGEAEAQKGLPANSLDMVGHVKADAAATMQKEAAKPKVVEHVKEDDAKAHDATIGNEKNVPAAKPQIPSGNAEMGNEGKDNVNPAAGLPEIPTGNAYMGGEAEAQKGLPANSLEMKGTVIADRKNKHNDKIASARFKKAQLIAGRYMAAGRIKEDAYEDMVEVLSGKPIDEMEVYANRLFGQTKVAEVAPANNSSLPPVIAAAVLQNNEAVVPAAPEAVNPIQHISSMFTLGSKSLDAQLRKDKER